MTDRTKDRRVVPLVLALGLLASFGPLCLDMYLPALPDLPRALHSTATAAQLSLTTCLLGLAVGQLLVGPLSDRVGRRTPLLAGLALFVLASAACALTTSMPVLLVLRLLQGAAGAAGIVLSRAIVADLFSGSRAVSMFAAIAAVNGFSPILAPLIGGQLLRVGSWRLVFWVLAGLGLVMVAAVLLVVHESLPVSRRSSHGLAGTVSAFAALLRDRVFVAYCLAMAFVTGAMFAYISGSPFLLQGGFGLSQQAFSLSFATNALGIVGASSLTSLLVRRTSAVSVLGLSVLMSLAGAAFLAVAVLGGLGLVSVLVGLFVMVSAVGFATPSATALAMQRHPEVAGGASALLGLLQFLFGAVAAPLAGLGDPDSGRALTLVALVASACAVGSWLSSRTRVRTA